MDQYLLLLMMVGRIPETLEARKALTVKMALMDKME
jgi:hypothetical protein